MQRIFITLLALLSIAGVVRAAGPIRVVVDPRLETEEPLSGRLIVSLLSANSPLYRTHNADGFPFFRHPQPLYGVDVADLAPGEAVEIGDSADAFPIALSELSPGPYKLFALLDRTRSNSDWRREAGNLYSDEYTLIVDERGPKEVTVVLSHAVEERPFPAVEGVRPIETRSVLLSEFAGEQRTLRAAVVEPVGYDPKKLYPTIYVVPGFGDDHHDALDEARRRHRLRMDDPRRMLGARAFYVFLDPEGPNGHHLFADSANNGPVGRALVEELIPAIERAYPAMRTDAPARLVTGHSSGGWSSLWLGLTYPDTFGAVWSSAPDPVDFRAFQVSNLYEDRSAYERDGVDLPSYRDDGRVLMTARQENRMEAVLGPRNSSGQQWDSWFGVFCPRAEDGLPAPLFDPETGVIDHHIAASMRRYDIGWLVRDDPERYLPLFRERVRLIVGDTDNFFLNEAVALLRADLTRLSEERAEPDAGARVRIVRDEDHGSIMRSDAGHAFAREMLEHIGRLAPVSADDAPDARVAPGAPVGPDGHPATHDG